MELIRAVELLEAEMAKYNLQSKGWKGAFMNGKRTLGLCSFRRRTIFISKPYIELNDEALILDTIRHEIAHALAGCEAAHGPLWKLQALACGARPETCKSSNMVNAPRGKYTGTCLGCGITIQRHKRLQAGATHHHTHCPRNLSGSNAIDWKANEY